MHRGRRVRPRGGRGAFGRGDRGHRRLLRRRRRHELSRRRGDGQCHGGACPGARRQLLSVAHPRLGRRRSGAARARGASRLHGIGADRRVCRGARAAGRGQPRRQSLALRGRLARDRHDRRHRNGRRLCPDDRPGCPGHHECDEPGRQHGRGHQGAVRHLGQVDAVRAREPQRRPGRAVRRGGRGGQRGGAGWRAGVRRALRRRRRSRLRDPGGRARPALGHRGKPAWRPSGTPVAARRTRRSIACRTSVPDTRSRPTTSPESRPGSVAPIAGTCATTDRRRASRRSSPFSTA